MAAIIRIKRSAVAGNPNTLGAGELAYSALTDNGSNGGDRLYIGMGTETAGNAVNHVVIGGKYFTDAINAATNANTVSTLVKRDASGNFSAGTITASLTGNASTATTLQTARSINGVSFNGSADITVTAAAGTLTGTTLNSTVVTSSLTSVGTIGTGVWQGTAVGVAYGGTGTTSGSITGTGALTFTAGGSNSNVNLAPTGTGTVDVNGKRITGVAEPTQPTDAVTKQYVDTIAEGLHIHEAALCATTDTLAILSGGTVTYANGTLGVGATLTLSVGLSTIDGYTLVNGDRILVKNQATAEHNGIYVRTSATVLTRAADFDTGAEIAGGDYSFVENGTLYNNTSWVQTEEVVTVGTDPVQWQQFSGGGGGTFTAGGGLTLNGIELNVGGTLNRILVNTDTVDISPNYVGQTSITTLGTISSGTWQGTLISPTYGGTGVNNGSKTITLGGNLATTGTFTTSLTQSANVTLALPAVDGTLATLTGTESLSNKTITLSTFSGTTVAASGVVTFTSTTDASAVGTAPVVLSGGLSVAKKLYVGDDIIGAGPGTLASPISVIDGFQIDCGTY